MLHPPIQIKNLELIAHNKILFQNFSTVIYPRSRIALIGRNGCGKSSLLKAFIKEFDISAGSIDCPEGTVFGYIPQIIASLTETSGAERFNKKFSSLLHFKPHILLLDEPTNHLDKTNKQQLARYLQHFDGTVITATHDIDFINQCFNTLFHIENGFINIFSGSYNDYIVETQTKRESIRLKLTKMNREKKETHEKRMVEQERSSKRKKYGKKKYEGDKLALRSAQGRGQLTSSKNLYRIQEIKEHLHDQLKNLQLPELIFPKFNLVHKKTTDKFLIQVNHGAVGYQKDKWILSDINLMLNGSDKIAIIGKNGSGKSTLIKAIISDSNIHKSGDWYLPHKEDFSYIDQHYDLLNNDKTVFDCIKDVAPHFSQQEIRSHLNDFLFRKNDDVNIRIKHLSGGEKARLSLAKIAIKLPRVLVLDEINNNLDIETKEHVLHILKAYHGCLIMISHEDLFLKNIPLTQEIDVDMWKEKT